MPDAHKNFAVSLVATAPSPAASGTSLVVTAGQGTRFPTAPFNATVCPGDADPTPANAEIVRVTGISTDTFTITRAQESSSARTVVVGDRIYAGPTAKTLTDVEQATALVVKVAEETVNNSAVLQNDDHLFFPIAANEVWFVEGRLICQGVSATADFKFGWTGPTGATAQWGFVGRASDVANNNFLPQTVGASPNAISAIGTALTCGGANLINVNTLAGWFTASSTPGTIQLQWAQSTQTLENSKVLANSFLQLRRLV